MRERSEKGDAPVPDSERGFHRARRAQGQRRQACLATLPDLGSVAEVLGFHSAETRRIFTNRDGHIVLLVIDASSNIGAKSLPLSRHDV